MKVKDSILSKPLYEENPKLQIIKSSESIFRESIRNTIIKVSKKTNATLSQ